MSLIYGLVTGILLGILFQKAEIVRFDKQVGALRLMDMTIFKFMLSAIAVGAVGVYLLKDLGFINLSIKGTSIGAQVLGGSLFGIGWAILGYCPGTAGGALGEGRIDAIWGILGMLFGGGIYALVYPFFKANVISIGNLGKITLPQVFGVNHWIIVVVFVAFIILMFRFFEKKAL